MKKTNFLTPSALTNLLALLAIGLGILLKSFHPSFAEVVLTMGLYAFSGGITNWLAVYMLFEKVPFLYGSGVIPARFAEFKSSIRTLLMEQFFREDIMARLLGDADTTGDLLAGLEQSINYDDVFDKLVEAIMASNTFGGMLKMFGGASALESLRPSVREKLSLAVTETLERAASRAGEGAPLFSHLQTSAATLIDARLEELTPLKVKELVGDIIRQHLGWLVVWGGVLGAILGGVAVVVQRVL